MAAPPSRFRVASVDRAFGICRPFTIAWMPGIGTVDTPMAAAIFVSFASDRTARTASSRYSITDNATSANLGPLFGRVPFVPA